MLFQQSWTLFQDHTGCFGQTSDAVTAHTQVEMKGAPKLPHLSEEDCHHNRDSIDDPVAPLERNLHGRPLAGLLWERTFEKVLIEEGCEKVPGWACLYFHKLQFFQSVHVDDMKDGRNKLRTAQDVTTQFHSLIKDILDVLNGQHKSTTEL